MIARFLAIAATLLLLAACSGSDETLADSAGSGAAAGTGIGTTDTTGLGAPTELGAGGTGAATHRSGHAAGPRGERRRPRVLHL